MNIATREQARAAGPLMLEAWDREMSKPRPQEQQSATLAEVAPNEPRERRSKLEMAFEERAKVEYPGTLFYESVKLRLAGKCWLTPDYLTTRGVQIFWEVKGERAWEDSIVKLKMAAETYPCFGWVLVRRPKPNRWECRWVNSSGISQKVWCPEWLR